MRITSLVCPSCRAPLSVGPEGGTVVCPSCGMTVVVEDETIHVEVNMADQEEAGYQFEKGRQRAQREAVAQAEATSWATATTDADGWTDASARAGGAPGAWADTTSAAAATRDTAPKKRKTWLWVLGWIFIYPVPLTILMLKSPRTARLNKALRVVIVVAGWLIYLGIGAC